MRGLTIDVRRTGHVELAEVAEPQPGAGELLVEGVALGVCGTDRWLVAGGPRRTPQDRGWLILGHESLGRVAAAPAGSRFPVGDLVTGLVRRPDPEPCEACARGDLDICRNGRYTERGIVGSDGYGAQRYLLDERYAVAVDARLGLTGVLVEPTSIVAKAWERLDAAVRRPGGRALILGAGPIGLLAALLAQQRGYDVHVVDRVDGGPKIAQTVALGATYHRGVDGLTGDFDAVLECSGELGAAAIESTARGGALCFIAGGHRSRQIEPAAVGSALTGGNRTFSGVTSSGREHFEAAHAALLAADRGWLDGLLTAVVPLEKYATAFEGGPDTIKSVIRLTGSACGQLLGGRPVQ